MPVPDDVLDVTMTDAWYGMEMGATEIEEFLNDQATGVLSLSRDGQAYGVPMSFAYDGENERAIMDMGFAPDSKKAEFLESTEEICLTVYDWEGPKDWRSVIVTGTLDEIPEDEIDDEIVSWFYDVAKDIDISGGDVEMQWYELSIDDVSGYALYE